MTWGGGVAGDGIFRAKGVSGVVAFVTVEEGAVLGSARRGRGVEDS